MKFLLSSLAVSAVSAADWAVLLAGSKTYSNYRHQSDVCNAYQTVRKFGIPDDHIIVMQFDDLAKSPSNPFPGQIFNEPTVQGTPGTDVYAGCKKDYSGNDVTINNFVAVLTGDATKTGGKPVLQSGANDRVFINFVDHGGVNIIQFPDGSLMQATQLNSALKTMHDKNMYQKLVFYMEACESGSMFDGHLGADLDIYVTTAANGQESSWGTYCPPDDMVDGKNMNTCLGDLYSVNWIQNADAAGPTETLQAQYLEVKNATTKSHVMQYGDLTWTSDPIGNFLGGGSTKTATPRKQSTSNVRSRDIPMHLAYYNYLRAENVDFGTRQRLAKEVAQQVNSRMQIDQFFYDLVQLTKHDLALFDKHPEMPTACTADCCELLTNVYHEHCGFDDYSLQYNKVLVNLCVAENHNGVFAQKLATTMVSMCAKME